MKILRTPDARFADLPDFDFRPHYTNVNDARMGALRIHHIDEGPAEAPVILCLHGEPSWSYLYRKMIPIFVAAGYRVVAPDLVGFGRSDKPSRQEEYSYASHVDWMTQWLLNLDLREATLVAQDWGGLIGLRLLAAHPARFRAVSLSNTGLPTGDQPLGEAFYKWRAFSQNTPDFDTGLICNNFGHGGLSAAEQEAYRAPFPEDAFKAGARRFPALVPDRPDDPAADDNRRAWRALAQWRKPMLLCYSDSDPVTAGADRTFLDHVPGSRGQPHVTLRGGHFVQEDDGPAWARTIVTWLGAMEDRNEPEA